MRLLIAVDGPAASGKGTVAAHLAEIYALPYLDTGLLYRAVGVTADALARVSGASLSDVASRAAAELGERLAMDDPRLRTREAGELASRVAVLPEVRVALLDFQRRFAAQPAGAVLDGRDIATVIAPEAPVKLFVTAEPRVRAERRWKQLAADGEAVSLQEVLADIRVRDERDSGRAAAPLIKADDAVLLDTSEMDISTAVEAARRLVEAARSRWEASRSG